MEISHVTVFWMLPWLFGDTMEQIARKTRSFDMILDREMLVALGETNISEHRSGGPPEAARELP